MNRSDGRTVGRRFTLPSPLLCCALTLQSTALLFEATSKARRMWRIDFELPNYTPLSQEREQHLHLRVNTRYNRFRWKMIAASRRADALISIAECAVESSLFAHHLSKVSTHLIKPARSRQPGATSDLTQIRQFPFTLPAGL